MWNDASEKKKTVYGSMLLTQKKAILEGYRQLRQLKRETIEFKKQKAKELKEKWSEKRMHGQFIRETTEKVDKEKTWQWLSLGI